MQFIAWLSEIQWGFIVNSYNLPDLGAAVKI